MYKHYKELNKRNLHTGFGAIVGPCERKPYYFSEMQKMVNEGHEILNHSYEHSDLTSEGADWDQELDQSSEVLSQHGTEVTAYLFPYDHSNDVIFQRLKDLGYLGARGGSKGINTAELDSSNPWHHFEFNLMLFLRTQRQVRIPTRYTRTRGCSESLCR